MQAYVVHWSLRASHPNNRLLKQDCTIIFGILLEIACRKRGRGSVRTSFTQKTQGEGGSLKVGQLIGMAQKLRGSLFAFSGANNMLKRCGTKLADAGVVQSSRSGLQYV